MQNIRTLTITPSGRKVCEAEKNGEEEEKELIVDT
jgi:hypothetical protein